MLVTLSLFPLFLRQTFPNCRLMLMGKSTPAILGWHPVLQQTPNFDKQVKSYPGAFVWPKISLLTLRLPNITLQRTQVPALTLPKVVLPKVDLRLPTLPRVALRGVLGALIAVPIIVMSVLVIPELYYRFAPADVKPIESIEEGSPIGGSFDRSEEATTSGVKAVTRVTPEKDDSLPEGNWLIIPRIGVRTELDPSLTVDEALAKGVWMAPEYGAPGDLTQPVILAAHRYGWQWWWKSDYWKYHSFYLLPELQPGDIVEVIADQRKYYYEIYSGEEGEEISDYTADMILYTCKHLSSPIRHFRYARLVDMGRNTQG